MYGFPFRLSFYYQHGGDSERDFVANIEVPLVKYGFTDEDILNSSIRDLRLKVSVINEKGSKQ